MIRWLSFTLLLISGCAALGGVSDGTSLAYGSHNSGILLRPVRLPSQGEGYRIPPKWVQRGNSFGTEELVALIVYAARRVHAEFPGSTLYVADLSPQHGGSSHWHRSHQNGRDADLLFFTTNDHGKNAPLPSGMTHFRVDGVAATSQPLHGLSFDLPRNWALVRALVESPEVEVQYIFVSAPIRELLLSYAIQQGDPAEIVARADAVLHQPEDSRPHDDHFHLRIHCPRSDRFLGCMESGPLRWLKKTYKYSLMLALDHFLTPLRALALRPFCQFLSSAVVALR